MNYYCLLFVLFISLSHKVHCEWDYLMFTQHWPPTVCEEWKQDSSKHECTDWKADSTWAVHGIWPSDIKGSDPSFCNASAKFNISLINTLIPSLEIYWPNMYKGTADDSFWGHEWDKHGTCATTDLKLGDEYAYFHSGIHLLEQYNFYKYLAEHGITPSTTAEIKTSDFKAAVKTAIGFSPLIRCYKHKEIRICLDKSLAIMECPEHVKNNLQYTESCPEKGSIIYPPVEQSGNTEESQHVLHYEF